MNIEIVRGIKALFPAGSLVELRIPKSSVGTIVGYFYDKDKLADAIEGYSGNVPAVYYTLNSPAQSLYDNTSAKDKAVGGTNATKDDQIVRRDWLLIDCDPIRVDANGVPLTDQKVSSSDSEKAAALATLKLINEYLNDRGWPLPVSADSGNGYHLLYNLGGMESTPELTTTVQTALGHLAAKFNSDLVKVDTSVFNPSRITKAYGSFACKGTATTERPHRLSKIRFVPDEIKPATITQLASLKAVVQQKPASVVIKGKTPERYATAVDDAEKMEEFLEYYDIDHKVRRKEADGFSWQIIPCPFNSEHKDGEVGVSFGKNGYGFKCFHESCSANHWQEFKSHMETVSGKKFFFKTNLKDAVQADATPTSSLVMQRASTITPEVLTWLWPNRIPFGKLTLFAGHPGIGKGMATMYVAACASTGTGWVDCENTNAPIESIIISSEDSPGDTLVPRLMAAGADMDKVIIVPTMKTEKGERAFGLDVDLPALRKELESNPNVKLIIIDPIMNHLGSLKGNAEQELRAGLTPLGMLADKFGVAVVLVTHFNKSIQSESIQRVGGAMGMVGAVRIAWTFTEDKEDGHRKMLPLKANIAPDTGGLIYKIVSQVVEINGQSEAVGKIEFGHASHSSVDSSLKNDAKNGVGKMDEAKAWLTEFLSDGVAKPVIDIQLAGDSMGFGKSTLLNAAIKIGCKKDEVADTWQLVKVE